MSVDPFGWMFDAPLSSPSPPLQTPPLVHSRPRSPHPQPQSPPARSRWETRENRPLPSTSLSQRQPPSATTSASGSRYLASASQNVNAGPSQAANNAPLRINLSNPSSSTGLPSLGLEQGGFPPVSSTSTRPTAAASGSGSGSGSGSNSSLGGREGSGQEARDGEGGPFGSDEIDTIDTGRRRRRVDEALGIGQGDPRGMSQILNDRRHRNGAPQDQDQTRNRSTLRASRAIPPNSAATSRATLTSNHTDRQQSVSPSARPGGSFNLNPSARSARPNGNGNASQVEAGGSGGRRRGTVVEIEDDSDDDIVFTGENRAARPLSPPRLSGAPRLRPRPHPQLAQAAQAAQAAQEGDGEVASVAARRQSRAGAGADAAAGQRRGRFGEGDFRRAMAEIDAIIDQRQQDMYALVAGQEDERRRQILSPPAPPPPNQPRQRIGLGGGGLYRRGERVGAGPAAADGVVGLEDLPTAVRRDMENQLAHRAAVRRIIGGAGPMRGADGGGEGQDGLELGFGALGGLGMLLLGPGRYGMGIDAGLGLGMGMGLGGAGPAGRMEDVQTILSRVEVPKYDPPPIGFSRDFEIGSEDDEDKNPITIDEEGNVVRPSPKTIKLQMTNKNKRRPYLICANCPSALLVSSAYKSETNADRVWALRCGHLIDQKCLEILSTPTTSKEMATVIRYPNPDLEVLDDTPVNRRNKRRKTTKKNGGDSKDKKEKRPDEYLWTCPVSGCEEQHVSIDVGGGSWVSREGEGAISVYA
ncbi:hypothetical protein IAT40_002234 [Kwoniella sp. CBS 6097]